jgi:hypothetical protein
MQISPNWRDGNSAMLIQVMRSGRGRMPCVVNGIVLAAILCCPAGVRAAGEDPSSSIFSLHGFGTLGVVYADARDADFVGSPFQPNGAGYSQSIAPGIDSKVGLQLGAQFTGKLSAIVQVVSQHLYDNTWRPQLEWANLNYQFMPDFSIRVGRSVAAPFLVSDTALVGYTYTWIRPPPELYGELPVSNLDGLAATYVLRSAAVEQTLSVSYGQTTVKFQDGGEVSARKFLQISDAAELGFLTFRIGYTSLRATVEAPGLDMLFAGLAQFGTAASDAGFPATGAQASALGAAYGPWAHSPFAFSMDTVGVSYDPGKWLLMSEWARSASDGLLANSTAWYLMGGERFGKFMPYLTIGHIASGRNSEPGIAPAGLPPPLAAAAAALDGGLTAGLRPFAPSQSSASVGVRWDVMKGIDLKLQYDRLRLDENSAGRLTDVQPGFRAGPDVNAISLAMDFVF